MCRIRFTQETFLGVIDKMFKPLRKAIIPVAGLGTRLLPISKAIPKEMVPVVDRPLIH